MPASALVGPTVRARVWLHRTALDRRLADGEDALASLELALRAGQLVATESRRELAARIEDVVEAAGSPAPVFSSSAPLARQAIRALRQELLRLATELQDWSTVGVEGVARTRGLLTDGGSPLYGPSDESALHDAIEAARAGLCGPPSRA